MKRWTKPSQNTKNTISFDSTGFKEYFTHVKFSNLVTAYITETKESAPLFGKEPKVIFVAKNVNTANLLSKVYLNRINVEYVEPKITYHHQEYINNIRGQKNKQIEKFTIEEVRELVLNKEIDSKRVKKLFKFIENKCKRCDRIGTYFALEQDAGGGFHYNLYSQDDELMTLDHILPKSKGGGSNLGNLQMMCRHCNQKKGNTLEPESVELK